MSTASYSKKSQKKRNGYSSHEERAALLRASVYGANDGIITTFAVVAGVAGARLSAEIVLILGVANMIADGLSMGLGDFLGEKSERRLLKRSGKKITQEGAWKTGVMTFVAFVIAGTFPLLPYFFNFLGFFAYLEEHQFLISAVATGLALFAVGVGRTFVTKGSWLKNGLEMLGVGAIAAIVAYALGAGVERLLHV